ncbi:MAG: hypothetical protein ACREA0_18210 [bacterium]
MAEKRIPEHLQAWIDARKRHKLSHTHAQMARELGMNPRKLGKLDNHHQEPWKLPLPAFIQELYFKRFGKERPDVVLSIEERARIQQAKKAARKEAKQPRLEGHPGKEGNKDAPARD